MYNFKYHLLCILPQIKSPPPAHNIWPIFIVWDFPVFWLGNLSKLKTGLRLFGMGWLSSAVEPLKNPPFELKNLPYGVAPTQTPSLSKHLFRNTLYLLLHVKYLQHKLFVRIIWMSRIYVDYGNWIYLTIITAMNSMFIIYYIFISPDLIIFKHLLIATNVPKWSFLIKT